MKIQKHNIVSFLLLAFLLSSVNAFAFSGPPLDLDSKLGNYLQTHKDKKAVLFEEFALGLDVRLTSDAENDLSTLRPEVYFLPETHPYFVASGTISGSLLNGKELISRQIFPFQFFW